MACVNTCELVQFACVCMRALFQCVHAVYVCRNVRALCSQEQCEFRHLLWELALPCWISQCFDTV